MTAHNHVTTTDHDRLFDALIGDQYDWDLAAGQTPQQEADSIIDAAAAARITVSDDAREALVGVVTEKREAIDGEVSR